jgi:hypothetical protein
MLTQPQRDIENEFIGGGTVQEFASGVSINDTEDRSDIQLTESLKKVIEKKTRNTKSYKSEYQNLFIRYKSMVFTASLGYIIAGIELIGIVILLFK